jgi:quercetin dioxygenase-like cupin family protein
VPGKAITTALVSFPPNAFTTAHRHPGSVTAFVTKGAIRSQLEGGRAITYNIEETWFEPPGVLHLFAENASVTEPAELLTVFITAENCGSLVIPEQ